MPAWSLRSKRTDDRARATELYGSLVAWARKPWLYEDLGAPDSAEGRLEMVMLHTALVLERLAADGPAAEPLGRALTETFVTDMDDCMREMGVSDISVARKVKKAAAALFDRTRDYRAALALSDDARLAELAAAHMLQPGADIAAAQRMASYARGAARQLADSPLPSILAGDVELRMP